MRFERQKRGYSRYFIIFIVLLAIIFGIIYTSKYFLKNNSFFNLDKIEFTEVEYLSNSFLEGLVESYYDQNIFSFSEKEIIKKFDNVIRIEDISVKKKLPNKLVIKIIEKKDQYYVKTRDGILIPISKDLIVLNDNKYYPYSNTQVISSDVLASDLKVGEKVEDPKIMRLVNYFNRVKKIDYKFSENISELYIDSKKDICLVEQENGNIAVLGENELEKTIKRFNGLIVELKNKKVILKYKDQAIIR